MGPDGAGRRPGILRRVASLLIGGPEAEFILDDLEELLARDLDRGMTQRRARLRYVRNLLGSSVSTWSVRPRARLHAGFSWLDFKLGFRMLRKYPGLTVVGGLAIAFAMCVGAATFEFLTQVFRPALPLPGGDRIVGIANWDAAAAVVETQALHDFVTWRARLETIEEIGAFRTLELNLITEEGTGGPIDGAEMSASGFRIAGVAPLLGRSLIEEDERPGAPPVVVLGFAVWQRHFRGDAGVVGRIVRLGSEQTTVVGVMPDGFGFPVAHGLWVPFRLNVLDYARRAGPGIQVFGRLAPGASLESTQAELTVLGMAAAAEFPSTHEHLQPRVMPYARSILLLNIVGVDASGPLGTLLGMSMNVPLVLFLVLVCANVALLMFARAATRESEIVVRNALGASRRRIVGQLFVEALVLGSLATMIGLAAAGIVLHWVVAFFGAELLDGGSLPFWLHASLSPVTVLYAGMLTLVGAAIAGVVPALKVTRGLGAQLRHATAGGGGFRFGGIWTAVIVCQIAVTMVLPVTMFGVWAEAREIRAVDVGFPEQEYLALRLRMDRGSEAVRVAGERATSSSADTSSAAVSAQFRLALEELERRLMAEPRVTGVSFADRLPRMYHPYRLVELDAGAAAPLDSGRAGYRVSSASVGTDYFEVLGVPILAGRGFHAADLGSEASVVIVNLSFVGNVLGGRNPIGRRLRYAGFEERDGAPSPEPQPWYEIVGVVRDLGMAYGNDPKNAGFYHPTAPGETTPRMVMHVAGAPLSFAPRLRSIAAAVDSRLWLHDVNRLDEFAVDELALFDFWFRFLLGVNSIALLLSLAGIYAVMSVTVSQRTREIGIRVALGADRRHIVAAIFRRPVTQVALGVLAGGALVAAAVVAEAATPSIGDAVVLVAYVTLMMGVCMLASIAPTRRALAVEPGEALRTEG